ncbi:MAG: hypothetical protein ACJAYU_004401 [Bradymonadia bacterium]|jgi:hypothetical protein
MKKLILASLLASLTAYGCGDEDETEDSSTTDVGADAVADTSADAVGDVDMGADAVEDVAGPDTAVDTGPDVDPREACEADWVEVVNGTVVDNTGTLVDGAKAQLCVHIGSADGNLICLRPEDTDAEGAFAIGTPNSTRCVANGSMRVFKPNAPLATTYCPIDLANEDGTLNIADSVVLFQTEAVAELPPYGDPEAARSVTFPGGLEIAEFVPGQLGFEFTEEAYGNLGAVVVEPDAEGLCFLDGPVDGLIAFTIEANLERSTSFRMPNTNGYDAGATVELFVLGGLQTTIDGGEHVPETEWLQYGQATVSADGESITGRLPAFTWLGYRLAE